MKKIFYSLFIFVSGIPIVASAADNGGVSLPNPLSVTTVPDLVDKIATFIVELASPVFVIMLLVGAFQMLGAAGNESKFAQGKKTITYTIVGMAVVLAAKGIAAVVKNFIGA